MQGDTQYEEMIRLAQRRYRAAAEVQREYNLWLNQQADLIAYSGLTLGRAGMRPLVEVGYSSGLMGWEVGLPVPDAVPR